MALDWNVIWDPTDRIEDAAQIFELGQIERSEVIYPGSRSSATAIAIEILVSLGKNFDGLPKHEKLAVRAAQMWLHAELVTELVIVGPTSRDAVETVVSGLPIRVWLVTRSEQVAKDLAIDDGDIRDLDYLFDSVRPSKKQARPARTRKKHTKEFPQAPFEEFFTYLSAAANMQLEEAELNRIVRCFYYEMSGAGSGLKREIQAVRDPDDRDGASFRIKAHIHRRMVSASSIREAVCRLRGIQAALFLEWIYVQVDLVPLLASVKLDKRQGEAKEIATKGRWIVDPRPGFLATLGHASNLTGGEISELTRSAVSNDGSQVKALGRTIRIPDELQAFARAYIFRFDRLEERPNWLFHTARGSKLQRGVLGEGRKSMLELDQVVGFSRDSSYSNEPNFFNHLAISLLERYKDDDELFSSI